MVLAKNRKARFEYHLDASVEAGMVLLGHEVKAIKAGRVHISEAHVIIKDGNVMLLGCRIDPTEHVSNIASIDKTRTIRLLLHRREIDKLAGAVKMKGKTIVPVDIHLSDNRIKMNIALAKGKNVRDKREDVKKRDAKRRARFLE